jgi:hypothetical protein
MELLQHEFIWCFNQNPENLNPPSSNTGVLGNRQRVEIGVRPDWLRLSFHECLFPSNIEAFGVVLFKRFRKSILKGYSPGWRLDLHARGQNGFLYAIKLMFGHEERASIQWGGESQRKRVMVELRGGICSLLRRQDWISLHGWATKFDGRVGRIDIAADDKNGLAFDVFKIRDDHKENPRSFCPVYKIGHGGRLPKTLWIEGEGATFYLGKSSSQLMHKVYQKGIQLSDTVEGKAFPRWDRWEVQFQRSNSSSLHRDILLPSSWVPAFIGSSNYIMERTDQVGARFSYPKIDPIHEPREVAARAIKALSEQWGGCIREMVRVLGLDAFMGAVERSTSNLVFSDLTRYDADAILEMLASLRDGGPACGSGALVACSSDVLEW